MSGRFLTKKDIHEAKRAEEIFNSHLKRGQVKESHNIVQQRHVVCGCGQEGCIFISCTRREVDQNRK